MPVCSLLRVGLLSFAVAVSVAAPSVAQGSRFSLWSVPQVDPIGLTGNTRSPAMYGAQLLLLYRPNNPQWRYGVGLSAMGASTASGPDRFSSTVAGVTVEVRRMLPPGAVRPYLVATSAIANLRVSEPFTIGDDLTLFGGSDATTALLGAGAGFEAAVGRLRLFSDLQYQWRSNAIYGRSALPLRLGIRIGREAEP